MVGVRQNLVRWPGKKSHNSDLYNGIFRIFSIYVSVYLHCAHVDEVTQVPAGHTLVLRDCMRKRERLSSPRSMLRYVILLNIHKGIGYKFGIACCCTLTSAADFLFPWQGTQPAVLQLFPKYSVDICKCTNAS